MFQGGAVNMIRLLSKQLVSVVIIVPLAANIAFASDEGSEPSRNYSQPHFLRRTFGSKAWIKAAAGAGVNQANDTPSEWGQGAAGFGRRFASAFGKHIIHKSIQIPVAKLLHEEFGYHPSGKTRFAPRLKYAIFATIITHKTTTGKQTFAVGEVSGAFGSGLISRLWQPASTASVGTGFASGGITLAVDAGLNVLREFWPEIRHPHSHTALLSPPGAADLQATQNELLKPASSPEATPESLADSFKDEQ